MFQVLKDMTKLIVKLERQIQTHHDKQGFIFNNTQMYKELGKEHILSKVEKTGYGKHYREVKYPRWIPKDEWDFCQAPSCPF